MRAAVKSDNTRRTITLEVSGVPDIDVTMSWHKKPRAFRPDLITITQVNGGLDSVNISGGLVLKSGAASTEVRENKKWYRGDIHRHPDTMPEWAKTLYREAPQGVTSWHEPDASNPEEVQAL